MNYKCLSLNGVYGFRHGLQFCSRCSETICTCLESFTNCIICNEYYCKECITIILQQYPAFYCSCFICGKCYNTIIYNDNLLYAHGNSCENFRNTIIGQQSDKLIDDVLEYIGTFLWNINQCPDT